MSLCQPPTDTQPTGHAAPAAEHSAAKADQAQQKAGQALQVAAGAKAKATSAAAAADGAASLSKAKGSPAATVVVKKAAEAKDHAQDAATAAAQTSQAHKTAVAHSTHAKVSAAKAKAATKGVDKAHHTAKAQESAAKADSAASDAVSAAKDATAAAGKATQAQAQAKASSEGLLGPGGTRRSPRPTRPLGPGGTRRSPRPRTKAPRTGSPSKIKPTHRKKDTKHEHGLTFSSPSLQTLECATLGSVPVWISDVDSCAIELASQFQNLATDAHERADFKDQVEKTCSSKKEDTVVLSCLPREDVAELIAAGFCAKGGVPTLAYDGRLVCSRQE